MPAIQVARTDTFEQQRQKINQLGSTVFNITAGGSDLSTGNLKLGDGTRAIPSLAFVSDSSVGIYKPGLKSIGFVSGSKKLLDFTLSGTKFYNDVFVKRSVLTTAGTVVNNYGSGYDPGTYTSIYLIGGSGQLATANFTVDPYIGSVTNFGSNYKSGVYTDISLSNGTGSGAKASFTVNSLVGSITSPGSGYVSASYTNIPLVSQTGSGSGALANITVTGGAVTSVSIVTQGINYTQGDILSAAAADLGNSGSGFEYTISSQPGKVNNFSLTTFGTGYQSSDVLSLSSQLTNITVNLGGTVTGISATLTDGSTTVTVSDSSNLIPGMAINVPQGGAASAAPGTTIQSITNSTTIILSTAATGSGTATVSFNVLDATIAKVSSTTGIQIGSTITKTSGNGEFAASTTITAINSTNSTVTLSSAPTTTGVTVATITPPYGSGSGFQYTLSSLGVISNFSISSGGIGYFTDDTFTVNPSDLSLPTTYIVTYQPVQRLTFSGTVSSSSIGIDNTLVLANGGGILTYSLTSGTASAGNSSYTNVSQTSTSGSGTGATFNISKSGGTYTIDSLVSIGTGYSTGDTITISGSSLGGSTPANNLVITVGNVIGTATATVLEKSVTGGNINFITIKQLTGSIVSGSVLKVQGTSTPTFTVSESLSRVKYYIDTGSGATLHPSITLYKGTVYIFDISASGAHPFYVSKHPDGTNNIVSNITSTLTTSSTTVSVSSTSGILPGMSVTVSSGVGKLVAPVSTEVVTVISVNPSSVTLSTTPFIAGNAVLEFKGTIYEGPEISRTSTQLKITPDTNTPTLYYFCDGGIGHEDEGGLDNQEASLTINLNNPKTFGSGFLSTAINVSQADSFNVNISTGTVTATNFTGTSASLTTGNITTVTSTTLNSSVLNVTDINSSYDLNLNASNSVRLITPTVNIGSSVAIDSSTGNLLTSGYLKTTNILNVNDKLKITDNIIESTTGNNLILTPATGRVAKINTNTAITIPSGNTSQRPGGSVVENGSIRFNTDTNQYEGYSGATSSWSSLGGVRDLDGNTYITAEFTIGSNDNTLWFYNDNNNTVKFTPEYQEFVSVKKVRSVNTSAPTYVNWAANTPVIVGQYLKYRNNIYEVVTAGTTGTSGNEPTSTTGTNFANGTATLKFFITAVAPLTFEEISEVRIAPDGGTSLSINSDLRFATNVISTDTNDLLLRPNSGKKVTVDAKTSLVLPVGTTNERGAPVRGSVRFNTTILQYEGYDGANWSSLGGVRDVDGNTYIIPELTPGGNQNILYFYNNGSNTLRVTENEIQLDTIDTITSPTSYTLNLDASLITFNNLAASIDTSSATTTFISTTKDNLDLGLSSGIVNDPLLRLSDTGDIFYNLGFGTGVYNGIKIFDKGLKELELADYKILTEDVTLTKNTVDAGNSIAYDPSIHRSAKVQIVAHNETTGDKEFVEYSVIDKGSDIFHTDFGNVKTGAELISSVFDFDANNRVRVTFTLDSAISAGNVVKVTVISNIIKR